MQRKVLSLRDWPEAPLENGTEDFPYYASYEEWLEQRKVDSKLGWLLWQSAVGRLSATCPEVKLT